MDSIRDEQIIALLKDKTSFEKGFNFLVKNYQKGLYRIAYGIAGCHEDANDIVQNSLVKAYKNVGRFKGDSKLMTWLYTIVRNESIDLLKKKKRVSELRVHDPSFVSTPALSSERIEDLLDSAISELPEKQKLVFLLRYYNEMSYSEISEKTSTSVGALKASYHHAVKKIESYIKDRAQG